MPTGLGPGAVFTTSDPGGGRKFTRFTGPIYAGITQAMRSPGGSVGDSEPPHYYNFSTLHADFVPVISSGVLGTVALTSSTLNVSTGTPAGLVYISQATGAGNLIAGGSTANAPTGLPGGQTGVAICWDSAGSTLAIYDPLSSAWKWPHSTSSGAGCAITWSASSS